MMDKSSGQSKYDDNSAYSKLKRLDISWYRIYNLKIELGYEENV